jgi:hypothetical protein
MCAQILWDQEAFLSPRCAANLRVAEAARRIARREPPQVHARLDVGTPTHRDPIERGSSCKPTILRELFSAARRFQEKWKNGECLVESDAYDVMTDGGGRSVPKKWNAVYVLAATALAVLAASGAASAAVNVGIGVEIVAPAAPPPPVYESVAPAPGAEYVWVPGHWHYAYHRWIWVPGQWEFAPYPGAVWIPGHWVHRAYGWVWIQGHWQGATVISAPPPPQPEVIPPPPYAGGVWIGGVWRWGAGRWLWVPGHWARRPWPEAVWVPGYWSHAQRGWVWIVGYWR